jgi:hypothetical protein
MDSPPRLGLLIVGCWLAFVGIWFSLGIFLPGRRARWGRRGQGGRMSIFSQFLWTVFLILGGVSAVSSAYHQSWPDHLFPVFFALFAAMLIMAWLDSRVQRDEKESF